MSSIEDSGVPVGNAAHILESNGPLARHLRGYEPRPVQIQMMTNVMQAYNQQQIALIEAGTGTGKSIAYLIPAILWAARKNERTVISTGTITLQEQLINKDIPLLLDAMEIDLQATLVKGMNNYVCYRKLEESMSEMRLFPGPEVDELEKIVAWSYGSTDGSRSTLSFVPSFSTWEKVGAEFDTCTRAECPHYNRCPYIKARRAAEDAHLLVVNHHLLFADLARRGELCDDEESGILPAYTRVIIDEAHNIEDIATDFFASSVSQLEIMRLVGRLSTEKQHRGRTEAQGKLPQLKFRIQEIFPRGAGKEVTSILHRLEIDLPGYRRDLLTKCIEAFKTFDVFSKSTGRLKEEESTNPGESKMRLKTDHHRIPDWQELVVPKAKELIETAGRFIQGLRSLDGDIRAIDNARLQEATKSILFEVNALVSRMEQIVFCLGLFLTEQIPQNKVRWIESQLLRTMTNTHLIDADLDISQMMVDALFSKFPTVILCSATMTTNRSFSFFRERLGLKENFLSGRTITENIYDAPFDYRQQALLTVPTDMPSPMEPDFIEAAVERIWHVVQASRGNAFVLFTSYGMLKTCYDKLIQRLKDNRYSVWKQGDDNRHALLAKFKTTDRSILFGTDSFWEGVDVVGEALRCVIIVKLPFKVPSEPIIQARSEAISAEGGDPFFDYALPHAIVKFKQGFGRLIRHKKDRGCVVCLDNRLLKKGYGKMFLNSLPVCQQAFVKTEDIGRQMSDFYRKTHYLVLS